MRQIPRIGIVGSGRLSRHFCHYFTLKDIPISNWSRKENQLDELHNLSENSDIIMILINDDAIDKFIDQNEFLKIKILIHCSASLDSKYAMSIHPLLSFSDILYDLKTYEQISFITDKGINFEQLFPLLNNKSYQLNKDSRSLYHSLCVLSGNFTCILWSKLFTDIEEKFAVPKEAAFPYLNSVVTNILTDHKTALTGPIIRGDINTINKNISALEGDKFQAIYKAFLEVTK